MEKWIDKCFEHLRKWLNGSHKVWYKVILINIFIWFIFFIFILGDEIIWFNIFVAIFSGLASGTFIWNQFKEHKPEELNNLWEKIWEWVGRLAIVWFIFYGVPLLYLAITSFSREIIFGDLNFSTYKDLFKYYTFDKVNGFYSDLAVWIHEVIERLRK